MSCLNATTEILANHLKAIIPSLSNRSEHGRVRRNDDAEREKDSDDLKETTPWGSWHNAQLIITYESGW